LEPVKRFAQALFLPESPPLVLMPREWKPAGMKTPLSREQPNPLLMAGSWGDGDASWLASLQWKTWVDKFYPDGNVDALVAVTRSKTAKAFYKALRPVIGTHMLCARQRANEFGGEFLAEILDQYAVLVP
jgi:hypothetical protein